MHLIPTIRLTLAALVAAACAGARQSTPPTVPPATPPKLPDELRYSPANPTGAGKPYLIHAITAEVNGARRYARRDSVWLTVRHTNPFLYQYRMLVEEQAISETAPGDFANVAFGLTLPQPVSAPKPPADTPPRVAGKPETNPCEEDPVILRRDDIDEVTKWLVAEQAPLTAAFRTAHQAGQMFDRTYATTSAPMQNPLSLDHAVFQSGLATQELANTRATEIQIVLDDVRGRVSAFADSASRLRDSVTAAEKLFPLCTVRGGFAEHREREIRLNQAAGAFKSNVTTLDAARKKAQDLATGLKRITDEPRNFYALRVIGDYDEPTDVSVRLQRRVVGDANAVYQEVASSRLNFGGTRRFAIGAGFAWAPLKTNTFGSVRQYVAPPAGRPADTLTTVIARTGNSLQRVSPGVALHARLLDAGTSWHGVMAATIRRASGDTNLEYFLGVGPGALNEWIILSVGAYAGTTHSLAAGFLEGQQIPSDMKDVPVRARTVIVPAALVSFKIR